MRTNVVIDDQLMNNAQKSSGLKSLVRLKKQEKVKSFRGKLNWTGNLDEMRRDN